MYKAKEDIIIAVKFIGEALFLLLKYEILINSNYYYSFLEFYLFYSK